MKSEDAKPGNIVEVTDFMGPVQLMVAPHHLDARRPDARGRIDGAIALEGTLLVWVRHGSKLAPYWLRELSLVGEVVDE
jgi:hypothetical protein